MKYLNLKQTAFAVMSLILLIGAFFYKIIFGAAWLWEDFTNFFFPIKYYILNTLKDGAFSFWNPDIFSGIPIAADIQIGLFYPLNLLMVPFAKMDTSYMYWLMEIQVIFHLLLGGISMYMLMRYLKVSHFGSLSSAIFFSLSSFFIVHLKHVNLIESAIWMPLIFLFFHKSIRDNSLKNLLYSVFFMGISILAGHPQITYLIFLFISAYWIFNIAAEKNISFRPFYTDQKLIKKIAFLSIFIILSLGVAAIELLPYNEIFNFLNRNASGSFSFTSSYSLHPVQFLITSLLPHFFGGQSNLIPYIGDWNYWELANYTGIAVLFLFLTGFLFLRTQRIIKFLLIVCAISILLSFGRYFFIYPIGYYLLPGLKLFRVPARFLFLYGFSLTIISGFALDFITDKNNFNKINLFILKNKNRCKTLFYILAAFLLTAAIGGFTLPADSSGMIENTAFSKKEFSMNALKNIVMFISIFSAIIFIASNYLRNRISSKTFKITVLILIIADIFWFGFEFNNGHYNPKDIFQKTPEIEYLEKNSSNKFRIIDQTAMLRNMPLLYDFRSIEGYIGTTESQRYKNFLGEGAFNYTFSAYPGITSSPHRLDLLNTCYILSNETPLLKDGEYIRIGSLNLYQRENCLNQIFITHRAIVENDPKKVLALIDKEDFDPLQEIILEENSDLTMPDNNGTIYNDSAEIIEYKPDHIEIKTRSEENGILFLSELYYPGWEAYIDGINTKIYRTNYIFRSVALPKGEHNIKFTYNPKIFKIGATISVISILFIIISLLYLSSLERKKIKI